MKLFTGQGTLLVAALLGLQQLSTGFPLSLTVPKTLEDLVRRVEPIIGPKPIKGPAAPATPAAPPRIGTEPTTPSDPPPRFGGDPPATGAGTGAAPAPAAPKTATLGTEDELVAMGLKPGSAERVAFDRFSTWFGVNKATNTERPWIFFTKLGDDGNTVGGPRLVPKFQDDFKAGKYRLPGDDAPAPTDKLQQLGEVFTPADLPNQVGPAPSSNAKFWFDMISSYGSARLAALRGGKVRILMPKDEPNTPDAKFWTDFEAFELTKPESNVEEIWRYNSAAFDDAPIKIWSQGDAPIGNQANFEAEIESDLISIDL